MQLESEFGGLVIKGIVDVQIPSKISRYPNRSLGYDLKRVGYRPSQINYTQSQMKDEEIIDVCVDADIIAPTLVGLNLQSQIFKGCDEDNLNRAQNLIKNAVKNIVGDGRYIRGRRLFDAMAQNEPKVAVIKGYGGATRGEWSLLDQDRQFVSTMRALIDNLEEKKRYSLIVADINNPTGYVKRISQDCPVFYVLGDPKGYRDLNRQISYPLHRRFVPGIINS
jgi:hypothetical protein